jgi:hypothetical protein
MLDRQTEDGTLRRWLAWSPPEAVAEMLPDSVDRDVAVPTRWSEQACGHVRLSDAYDADRAEAIARGWPGRKLAPTHLATYTQPDAVLEAILQVVEQIPQSER